ncbi:MAG: arabinose ABC transporter substrate-binding protein [Armatimonadetes bacterium]|nr:arabinose ABC transporter substrate-binding protein [Armatimonadota bacterium]
MVRWYKLLLLAFLSMLLFGCSGGAPAEKQASDQPAEGSKIKIAFIVKQPEEPWFQLEWRFADEAAKELGFELIKIAATDSEQVLSKIENAAAQGAQGLIICTPDVRLGPAIVSKCQQRNLKLLTVDDQLLGADGKFLDVHHLGISAKKIGISLGESLIAEMGARGWKPEETGMLVVTRKELDTARERTDGAIEGAKAKGFPAGQIYETPQKTTDVPGGRDAATVVLTQHPNVKYWLIAGMNDSASMGAVRATEAFNIPAERVIGIGINGDSALEDLKKEKPTGLFGSILLQAKRHGHDTCEMMFKWLKEGVEPPRITYTDGILITRDNYKKVLEEQGLIP